MKKKRQKQKARNKPVVKTVEDHIREMSEVRVLEELGRRDNLNTPDFLDLKEKSQFVFVYGTLKNGGRLTDYLDGCPFLGEGVTAMSAFQMKISKAGNFPVVLEAHDPIISKRVLGEVYLVDPLTLLELDRVESNGEMFIRKQRWIWLEDQRTIQKNGKNLKPCEMCWVYEGNPLYWQGREVTNVLPKKYGEKVLLNYEEKEEPLRITQDGNEMQNVFNSWAHRPFDPDFYNDQIPFGEYMG